MKTLIVHGEKLWELVNELVQKHEVIAPRDALSYGAITSANDILFGSSQPRRSLKEFFFTPRCELFHYQRENTDVRLLEPLLLEARPRIIFGAHPCDVAALVILDKVFMWDSADPFYVRQRQNTTIVSLACDEPCATCFCSSVGGSPAGSDGSDLLLSSLDESHYHVQIISERGQDLVAQYRQFFTESSPALDDEITCYARERHAQVTQVAMGRLGAGPSFDNPAWQTIARQCVDCGICTFVCPTCHCFDIQDEGSPTDGARVRLWDSCAFRSFTKTVVHEPRATHVSRYRQRIMHKFSYYPRNFGKILCVGCGRCIQHCPVSVDIRQVLEQVAS